MIKLLTRSRSRSEIVLAVVILACLSFAALFDFSPISQATRAQRRTTRRQTRAASRKPAIDYSRFSHATEKHRGACNTCHKIPTKDWKKTRDYPDVADYPDHDACVSCHRSQFFRGAKPPICSVCHTKVSPRDDARFAFRNPASNRQFLIEFPHDRHQDVIAQLERLRIPASRSPRFVRASFISVQAVDAEEKTYNNCAICHTTRERLPNPPPPGWPDGFTPDRLTFKSVPLNHAACFNCHWKSEEPVRDNCAGCHKLTSPYVASDSPKRISLKFRHDGGGERRNHVAECTTCHINITRAATLRGLKPDVPITACTECHNKDGLRLDVSGELEAIDKNRDFVCVYCHTSNVGRLDPPPGHYLIAGREPRTRRNLK